MKEAILVCDEKVLADLRITDDGKHEIRLNGVSVDLAKFITQLFMSMVIDDRHSRAEIDGE